MPLPAQLPIVPFARPVSGEVTLPGSKSLTNRALLLAALCDGPVTLTGALFSDDTRLMAAALRKIGLTVEEDENACTLCVGGQDNAFKSDSPIDLYVGLAGTAARFLTALCAAAPHGVYRIQGTERMNQRPMKGLIDALRALGADIRCTDVEGFFPIEIHAKGIRGGTVSIDASESSQMLSALLMVGPMATHQIRINPIGGYRKPFVDMTIRFCAEFGGQHSGQTLGNEEIIHAPWGKYRSPEIYGIEPDATAATYFEALSLITGGNLYLPKLKGPNSGLQGDTRFLEIIQALGGMVSLTQAEPAGLLQARQILGTTVQGPSLDRLGVVQETDFSGFSDTFLTLAAIAPLLAGPTKITGIAHSRKQETDRVAGMARELGKLGQHVIETEDSLEIHPRPLKSGVVIETYHDHRFAMSFGILGCHDLHGDGRPWLTIDNPACCAKTFPNFFELLESLRAQTSRP